MKPQLLCRLGWSLLVLAALAGCGGNGAHSPPAVPPGPVEPGPDGLRCRQGDVLAGVYHPKRLQVVKTCQEVTGKVVAVRHESDGDYHINVQVDPAYSALIKDGNRRYQRGALVVEIIPADQKQVKVPKVGQRVRVIGAYVLDKQHYRWAEIHPAWVVEKA